MEQPEDNKRDATKSSSLRDAISQARLDEAQHIDTALDLRSAELTRLEILKSSLEGVFDDIPESDERFELALVPSTPARLWIDMFTFVELDPEGELYRFIRNERSGRRILVESHDAGVIRGRITEYIARQIVARERELSGLSEMVPFVGRRPRRQGVSIVIAAFVIGVLTGVVGLFAFGWLITQ
jgi:hypothetical protein